MKRQLTNFQRICVVSLADFLNRRGIIFRQRLDGRKEIYLIVSFEDRSRDYEVYVYEDEIGFAEGDSWKIWETPDYDSASDLVRAFMDDFQASVDRKGN